MLVSLREVVQRTELNEGRKARARRPTDSGRAPEFRSTAVGGATGSSNANSADCAQQSFDLTGTALLYHHTLCKLESYNTSQSHSSLADRRYGSRRSPNQPLASPHLSTDFPDKPLHGSPHLTCAAAELRQAMAPAHANGTRSYSDSVQARQARFRPAKAALDRTASYSVDAQFTVPHGGTHIHAFAAPPCSSHLYTGGSDGYIRRYALHATLNGSGVDNPLVPNLTSKPGGHERPPGTDTRQPVLSGYWENEEPGDWADDVLLGPGDGDADGPSDDADERQSRVRWGAKTGAWGPQSAVYSLAVQKEELWGLSGTSVSPRNSLSPIPQGWRAASTTTGKSTRSDNRLTTARFDQSVDCATRRGSDPARLPARRVDQLQSE